MDKVMIPFIDVQAQRQRLGSKIDDAIAKVLNHGIFIGGPEVVELEGKLAEFGNVANCISCANGTDALQLVLMAEGVGPGDAVFVPAFTFVASGEVVPPTGASLVLVDVQPDTFLIDPSSLEYAIEDARRAGLRPRMVIAVDLFGLPAEYDVLQSIVDRHDMTLVADAAQSFGATYKGRPVGCLADYTTTSFFPAKPLGCYGDGGAIFTDNSEKTSILRSLCVHGKGDYKYDNVRIGINSRLDTIQAAVLLEKLAIFPEEIEARQEVAARYDAGLSDIIVVPTFPVHATSAWAQYTVKIKGRDEVQARCKDVGVPTVVYYPLALNQQVGYRDVRVVVSGVTVSENLCSQVLSLPMHPYLDRATQNKVIECLRQSLL